MTSLGVCQKFVNNSMSKNAKIGHFQIKDIFSLNIGHPVKKGGCAPCKQTVKNGNVPTWKSVQNIGYTPQIQELYLSQACKQVTNRMASNIGYTRNIGVIYQACKQVADRQSICWKQTHTDNIWTDRYRQTQTDRDRQTDEQRQTDRQTHTWKGNNRIQAEKEQNNKWGNM